MQEGCSLEEGMALIKKAIHELSVRFLISQPKFIIKVGLIVKTRHLSGSLLCQANLRTLIFCT